MSSGDATFGCEVNGLDQQKLNSYQWQWRFQERVIKENEKYRVFYHYQPPNVCQQSRGSFILQIKNISKEDLGQYICVLQLSNITLAEIEIPFYDFGKISISIILSATISSHLISSHLISSHLISSHLISSHLISSHLISSHLISSHLISSHLISSHLISSHLFPSHPISAQLSSAQLSSAQLSSAQLSSAQLSSAQLSSAQLPKPQRTTFNSTQFTSPYFDPHMLSHYNKPNLT